MTEAEHCYDLLVQCGYTPLTVLVNMRWKRDVLEKHNVELAEYHDVRIKDLRREYEESRQTGTFDRTIEKHCEVEKVNIGYQNT